MGVNGIKQAATYNLIAKFSTMFIQLVLNMVLARLIAPEAFGVISVITVLINFFNLFADMGIGVSVIQKTDMTRDDHNVLFTFSLYIGLVLAFVMLVIAYPVSLIYDNEIYRILCPCVSVIALLNSLNTVPNALLSRDKRFDLIALRSVVCNFISGAITVIFALMGLGVYALLLHSIMTAIAVFVWNYAKSRLRFDFRLNIHRMMGLLGSYSLFQLLFNILNYLTRNLDNLIVGATMGEASLGYYNKAYTLNLYPNTIFTNVISSVLHPYMRDYKDCLNELYAKIMKIIKPLSLVAVLIQIVFFWCSEEIIAIMYGDQWHQAAVCFRWLSICVWAQMLSSVCGAVFLGLQRTDQTLKCGIINFFLILVAIGVGVYNRSMAILSIAVAITYVIIFALTYIVLIINTMHLSLGLMIKTVGADFIAIVLFCVAVSFVPAFSKNIWLSLFLKLTICLMYYVFYLLLTGQFLPMFRIAWTIVSGGLSKIKNKKTKRCVK